MSSLGHRTRATVAVLAALAGPAALAAAPAGAAPSAKPAAALGGSGRGHGAYVAGWALLGPRERVRGGVVRVWSMEARSILVGAPDRTSKTGTFDVRVRRLPRRFVVSVTGGRVNGRKVGGTLGVVVEGRRVGDTVVVTPLSTVIAARVGARWSRARVYSRWPVARAEREARRLFKLPAWYDLYGDARIDARAFDGGRFLRAAHRRGGLQAYADRLARRLSRGGHVTFRGRANARTSGIGDGAISLLGLVGKGAAGGVGSAAVGKLFATLGFGDSARLAEMQRTLEEIKQQLTVISQQLYEVRRDIAGLERQIAASTYAQLVDATRLSRIGTDDDRIARWMAWLVDESVGCAAGDARRCSAGIPEGAAPLTWCMAPTGVWTSRQAVVCDVIRLLDATLDGGDYDELQSRLAGRGRLGVIEAYQKLLYANAKTGSGFVTADYRAQAAKAIERWSWTTAILAQYFAEHSALKGLPAGLVLPRVRQAESNVAELAALAPRRLPQDTVVDVATGTAWHLLDNPAQACGGKATRSRHLWWRADEEGIPDPAACGRQRADAVAAIDGSAAWDLPNEAEAKQMLARARSGSGGSNVEALRALGLPDLSGLHAAYPAPPSNSSESLLNRKLVQMSGSYFGNPGTAAGMATRDCIGMAWYLGSYATLWNNRYELRINGVFCRYVRLADSVAPLTCVKAFQWAVVNYDMGMPCETPSSTYRVTYNGYAFPSNGPVDWGHPQAQLLKRPVTAEDRWFSAP